MKPKKLKKVAYRFIRPESEEGAPLYRLLAELVLLHHAELADARIALAWNLAWKPDVDGRVTLGKCKKVGDLEREWADVSAYDFVIILQRRFWTEPLVTDLQRRALLDHELCHAAVKYDAKGEREVDEQNRVVYRTRKHDLEEFACIAERYGCWKGDLTAFADALTRARERHARIWIGLERLYLELRAAGLTVPREVIATWSDDQRRDAATWASLRNDVPDRMQDTLILPGFLRRATESRGAEA